MKDEMVRGMHASQFVLGAMRSVSLGLRWRAHATALAGYLALALVFTWPLAAEFERAIPGDGFDGLQNYWNLWWVRRALLDLQTSPFFTRDLFFPSGASLYFHTLNFFNGLWTLPLQLLGGLAVSYNGVVVFAFVLSGYGAWLLSKEAFRRIADGGWSSWQRDLAAFGAGFVFAFAPVRFAHLLGHMQVLSTEWLPFFVLAYVRMDRRRGGRVTREGRVLGPLLRRAALPAVFLALNALCDWYFVLYGLVLVGLVVVWRWGKSFVALGMTRGQARSFAALRITGEWLEPVGEALAVGAVFALLLSPVLVPMLGEAAGAAYLRPPFDETVQLSADLLAFVTPSEFQPWWGEAGRAVAEHFTSSTSERTVFAGYAALALAALGVWRFRRAVTLWVMIAVTFFVLALGPYLHVLGGIVAPLPLPYAWLYSLVPLVRITRSVSRFDVMVMLALGVLAGFGVLALRRRPWVALAVCGVVAVEFLAIPYPMWPVAVPAFYEELAREPGEFAVLELPINWDRPDPLLYQTVHGHPLLTAYTSRSNPLSVVEQTPVLNLLRTLEPDILQYDVRAVGASVLTDMGVRYVINHPLTMGAGEERTVTNRVLQQLFGSPAPLVNEPNLAAYRVTPPAAHIPYAVLGSGWGELTIQNGAPTRVISGTASLLLPGPVAQAVTLRVTAASMGASARLFVSDDERDANHLGRPLALTTSAQTFTVRLPALSRVWLMAEGSAVVVGAVEVKAEG
jgi:hypothetical protein